MADIAISAATSVSLLNYHALVVAWEYTYSATAWISSSDRRSSLCMQAQGKDVCTGGDQAQVGTARVRPAPLTRLASGSCHSPPAQRGVSAALSAFVTFADWLQDTTPRLDAGGQADKGVLTWYTMDSTFRPPSRYCEMASLRRVFSAWMMLLPPAWHAAGGRTDKSKAD